MLNTKNALTTISLILLFNQVWSMDTINNNNLISDTIKNLPDTVLIKSLAYPINLVISEEQSNDLITGVFIPIGMFILGYLINYLIGYFSKRKELDRTYRRWKAEINSLRSPMINQVIALKKFISDQSDDEFTLSDPIRYTGLSCEVFKSLDKGELLNAIQVNLRGYKKDEKLKEALRICNSTLGYIEIVSANYDTFLKKMDEFLDNVGTINNEFNSNYQELFLAYRNMGIELELKTEGRPTSIPEFKQIAELMYEYLAPENSTSNDIFDLEKNLFFKLDPLITNLRGYESYSSFYRFNHACITNVKSIRLERIYLNYHIEVVINKYEKLLSELDAVVSLSPDELN